MTKGNLMFEVFIDVKDEEVLPHHTVEDEAIMKMRTLIDKFEAMEKMIENKFTAVENKFTSIDQRLATIEAGNMILFSF